MRESRPALFRGRHFRSEVIVLCVRWYLRYPLSYRDLEGMMTERGLALDHSTIARWVLYYASILNRRIRQEMRLAQPVLACGRDLRARGGKMDISVLAPSIRLETPSDFLLSPNWDLIAAKG